MLDPARCGPDSPSAPGRGLTLETPWPLGDLRLGRQAGRRASFLVSIPGVCLPVRPRACPGSALTRALALVPGSPGPHLALRHRTFSDTRVSGLGLPHL